MCNTVDAQECSSYDHEKKYHQAPKENCGQVPKENYQPAPRKSYQQLPKQSRQHVLKKSCTAVPIKSCTWQLKEMQLHLMIPFLQLRMTATACLNVLYCIPGALLALLLGSIQLLLMLNVMNQFT